jgi:hypothetical protein
MPNSLLYTRSSFINYLTKKRDCEIINLNDIRDRVISIRNGPARAYIMYNRRDSISYEEIALVCAKLYIELPGEKDLVRIE